VRVIDSFVDATRSTFKITMEGGTITADNLEGPLKDKPLSELAVAGANGSLYINIHTEQYPNGEIRGQIEIPTD
jgi:hypothetical protein